MYCAAICSLQGATCGEQIASHTPCAKGRVCPCVMHGVYDKQCTTCRVHSVQGSWCTICGVHSVQSVRCAKSALQMHSVRRQCLSNKVHGL